MYQGNVGTLRENAERKTISSETEERFPISFFPFKTDHQFSELLADLFENGRSETDFHLTPFSGKKGFRSTCLQIEMSVESFPISKEKPTSVAAVKNKTVALGSRSRGSLVLFLIVGCLSI